MNWVEKGINKLFENSVCTILMVVFLVLSFGLGMLTKSRCACGTSEVAAVQDDATEALHEVHYGDTVGVNAGFYKGQRGDVIGQLELGLPDQPKNIVVETFSYPRKQLYCKPSELVVLPDSDGSKIEQITQIINSCPRSNVKVLLDNGKRKTVTTLFDDDGTRYELYIEHVGG